MVVPLAPAADATTGRNVARSRGLRAGGAGGGGASATASAAALWTGKRRALRGIRDHDLAIALADRRSGASTRIGAGQVVADELRHGVVAGGGRPAAEDDGHHMAAIGLDVGQDVEARGPMKPVLMPSTPSIRPRSRL